MALSTEGIVRRLGILEVIFGTLCVLFGSIVIAIIPQEIKNEPGKCDENSSNLKYLTNSSQGIWGGFLIIITGILGILMNYGSTRCFHIANVSMAIVTATISAIVAVMSGFAADFSHCSSNLMGFHSTVAALAILSFIVTIFHSTFVSTDLLNPSDNSYSLNQRLESGQEAGGRIRLNQRRNKTVFILGVTEVILGLLCFIAGAIVVAMVPYEVENANRRNDDSQVINSLAKLTHSGNGIWGGFLLVVLGIFGMRLRWRQTIYIEMANMIMAVAMANITAGVVAISIVAAAISIFSTGFFVVHVLLVVFSFPAFLATFIHSSCFSGCCCG